METIPRYTQGYGKGSGKKYDKKINNKFELFIWNLEKHILTKIRKNNFKTTKNKKHLDFACGTGRVIKHLEKNFENQTGIDTSKYMVEEAKKKTKKAKYVVGNILDKKLTKQKFDLITSFRLFLNLDKEFRVPILKELRTHLKYDGLLVVNNHMNRYSLLGIQFFLRKKLLGQGRDKKGKKGVINTMSEYEFRKHLNEAGFKVEEVYRFTLLPGRNNCILLPEKILEKVELFLSKIPILNLIGKDQIYVCTRK